MSAFDDPPPVPRDASEDRHVLFLKLFLGSEKEVFRYICAMIPCLADAQDVLQQTALALWRKFEAYDASQPFTPWACRFASVEIKEFLRRNGKWQALLSDGVADEIVRRREELAASIDRRLAYLAECLDKLPGPQRNVVESYYYDRRSVEEVASGAGRTVEAIYKSLQRIRQSLLDCVTASAQRAEARA